MAKSASSIHFWTLWWKHISIGNMPGYIVLVTSLLPGGSLSCRRQVPLVLQQQRLRGVEKWSRLHPDWAQVSLKRFEAKNKMTLQVRVRVHAKVVQGLRDAVLHRGERDRKAGGGLCLPGERRGFDSFADLSLQIVPTGKPSPLTGCQIVNKTLTSLKVQCQEGKPGPKEEIFTFKRKILF